MRKGESGQRMLCWRNHQLYFSLDLSQIKMMDLEAAQGDNLEESETMTIDFNSIVSKLAQIVIILST